MRLSTKGRYAVTAMLDLTLQGGDGPVTLAEISETQGISLHTWNNFRLPARQAVGPWCGPGGGYYLGRPAEEISIADIICAVDEWVEFTRCGGKRDCKDGKRCLYPQPVGRTQQRDFSTFSAASTWRNWLSVVA